MDERAIFSEMSCRDHRVDRFSGIHDRAAARRTVHVVLDMEKNPTDEQTCRVAHVVSEKRQKRRGESTV